MLSLGQLRGDKTQSHFSLKEPAAHRERISRIYVQTGSQARAWIRKVRMLQREFKGKRLLPSRRIKNDFVGLVCSVASVESNSLQPQGL